MKNTLLEVVCINCYHFISMSLPKKIINNVNAKPIKEFGIKDLLRWIFDILLFSCILIIGISTIISKHWFSGLLFVLLSPTVFVPNRYLRITGSLKRIIIIILFIVLAGLFSNDIPKEEQKYENYELGNSFILKSGDADFSVAITNISQNTQATINDEQLTTSGYFLTLTGEIKNLGTQPLVFNFGNSPKLTDSQNRTFTLRGSSLAGDMLQPGVSKRLSLTFEIPKDALDLKLVVQDSTNTIKSIDLKR